MSEQQPVTATEPTAEGLEPTTVTETSASETKTGDLPQSTEELSALVQKLLGDTHRKNKEAEGLRQRLIKAENELTSVDKKRKEKQGEYQNLYEDANSSLTNAKQQLLRMKVNEKLINGGMPSGIISDIALDFSSLTMNDKFQVEGDVDMVVNNTLEKWLPIVRSQPAPTPTPATPAPQPSNVQATKSGTDHFMNFANAVTAPEGLVGGTPPKNIMNPMVIAEKGNDDLSKNKSSNVQLENMGASLIEELKKAGYG